MANNSKEDTELNNIMIIDCDIMFVTGGQRRPPLMPYHSVKNEVLINNSEEYPELKYFMNEELSDVVFIVEGKRVPAIKSYLSVKSEVFRDMFSGKELANKEVVIEDTTYAFKTFILFLYCDELVLNENDFTFIVELFKLSHKYRVLRFKRRIIEYLLSLKLDFNVWEDITRIAYNYQIKELKERVMDFMENNLSHFVAKDVIHLNQLTDNGFLRLLAKSMSLTKI